jgi:hypothetical protein
VFLSQDVHLVAGIEERWVDDSRSMLAEQIPSGFVALGRLPIPVLRRVIPGGRTFRKNLGVGLYEFSDAIGDRAIAHLLGLHQRFGHLVRSDLRQDVGPIGMLP